MPTSQRIFGRLAQRLAHFPDTEGVTGSIPVSPTRDRRQQFGRLAQRLAHFLHTEGVIGSIPISPTVMDPPFCIFSPNQIYICSVTAAEVDQVSFPDARMAVNRAVCTVYMPVVRIKHHNLLSYTYKSTVRTSNAVPRKKRTGDVGSILTYPCGCRRRA